MPCASNQLASWFSCMPRATALMHLPGRLERVQANTRAKTMPDASSLTLHNAARTGNLAELGKCLSEDVDVNATDKHQRTALHLAAWAGHSDVVKALLSAPGVQKKVCAMDQMTALHFGAMNGHTEVCRVLLNAGIPVNTKTRKAITPLHFACQKGHEDTVQLLLKRKAAPYMKDSKGENALDKCKNSEPCRAAVQAAMDAVAASGTAFAQKRGRKEEGGAAAAGGKDVQEDSGDDDEEEDIIPIKRPLVAPRPAPKMQPQPAASSVASHNASDCLPGMAGVGTASSCQQAAEDARPSAVCAGDAPTAHAAEPSSGSAIQQSKSASDTAPEGMHSTSPVAASMRPPVAGGPRRALPAGGGLVGPPVAAPMRPPVARGPKRALPAEGGVVGGPS